VRSHKDTSQVMEFEGCASGAVFRLRPWAW
jgi:hypothetical protein